MCVDVCAGEEQGVSVPQPRVAAPHQCPGAGVHRPLALRGQGPVPADHHEAGVGRHGDAWADPVTLPGPQHLEYDVSWRDPQPGADWVWP